MVKQREGYQFVILEPAKTWLAEGKCAGCGKPKSEWTRSTRWKCCSVKCTNYMQANFQYFGWPELRMKAFKRDDFTCRMCGQKPVCVRTEFEKMYNGLGDHDGWVPKKIIIDDPKPHQYAEHLIGDHIIPIALNGNEWDIDNVQTLCIECNKKKTQVDAGKIAALRTKEKLLNAGQAFLGDIDIDG